MSSIIELTKANDQEEGGIMLQVSKQKRIGDSLAKFWNNKKNYSKQIIALEDVHGKNHTVLKNIEIAYHNMGTENIKDYLHDSSIPSYARLIYFLIWINIERVEIYNFMKKSNEIKYYISANILDFNVPNNRILEALQIAPSTLNDDIIKLENLKILSRKIRQEKITSKDRRFSIDIKALKRYMTNDSDELDDLNFIKSFKRDFLQLRKILLYRILTIVNPGFKRGFTFQKLLKYQHKTLNMNVSEQLYKKNEDYEGYYVDQYTGEFIRNPLPEIQEIRRKSILDFVAGIKA